jgi:hypothetical protein
MEKQQVIGVLALARMSFGPGLRWFWITERPCELKPARRLDELIRLL